MTDSLGDGIAAVVMAAGMGTRLKSSRAKALLPLCGRPIGIYALESARNAGIERVVAVVGYQADEVERALGDEWEYVLQEPLLGTGHALMSCCPNLGSFEGDLLVSYADMPLIGADCLRELVTYHRAQRAAATVLSAIVGQPGRLGRIVRGPEGELAAIVEAGDATEEQLTLNEINTGTYVFRSPLIFNMLAKIRRDNAQAEYYLTDVIGALATTGEKVQALAAPRPESAMGINTRVELASAEAIMRQRVREQLMLSGVTLMDPVSAFIDAQVTIGADTVIYPQVVIEGRSAVGVDCVIGPCATIADSEIGDRARVCHSVLRGARVAADAQVGPFTHLGSREGEQARG